MEYCFPLNWDLRIIYTYVGVLGFFWGAGAEGEVPIGNLLL